MKVLIFAAVFLSLSALAEDEEGACNLLDNSTPAKAIFHCKTGEKTYHVSCDVSTAGEVTAGNWARKDGKSGIEFPNAFAACDERELFIMGGMQGERLSLEVKERKGRTYLVASEILGRDDLKLRSIERQRVDMELRGKERIAGPTTGFKCKNSNGEALYAVIGKSQAKRTESFSPTRAWTANESNFKLWPVKNVKGVKCSWDPESTEEYPF